MYKLTDTEYRLMAAKGWLGGGRNGKLLLFSLNKLNKINKKKKSSHKVIYKTYFM